MFALTVLAMFSAQVGAEGLILCICVEGHVSLSATCGQDTCCQDEMAADTATPYAIVSLTQHDLSGDCCYRIPLYMNTERVKELYDGLLSASGTHIPALTRVQMCFEEFNQSQAKLLAPVTHSPPSDDYITSTVILLI